MDRRLLEFIDRPVSNTFLQYLAQQASQVISCHPPTATTQLQIPPLPSFISLVVRRSNANAGTLLGTLVLLDRLRHSLTPPARGMPCTCQRIFLATLIVTHKVLHDTAPRNRHWTRYAYYFATNEINLMEKQLLMLLDYRLSITLDDLYRVLARYIQSTTRRPYQNPRLVPETFPPVPVASSSSSSIDSIGSSSSNDLHSADDANSSTTSISSHESLCDMAIKSYYVDRNSDPMSSCNNWHQVRRSPARHQQHPP